MKRLQLVAFLLIVSLLSIISCTSKEKPKQTDPNAFNTHEEQSQDSKLMLSNEELSNITSPEAMAKVMLMPQRVIAKLLATDHKLDSKLYHSVLIIDKKDSTDEQKNASNSAIWEEQHLVWRSSDGAFFLQFVPQSRNGLELIWDTKKLYLHFGQGPWRKEVSDGKHIFYLEKATSAKERFFRLFRGHLKFTKAGEETYQGKQAIKVSISLDKQGHKPIDQIPITTKTKNKYRLNIKATNRSIEKERPRIAQIKKLDGELLIDKQTGVPLKGWLEATYLENIRNDKQAEMSMRYEFAYSNFGKPADIKPPDQNEETKNSVIDQTKRRRWVPKAIFKDMPKDLQQKSGVNKPRKVMPEKPKPKTNQKSKDQKTNEK